MRGCTTLLLPILFALSFSESPLPPPATPPQSTGALPSGHLNALGGAAVPGPHPADPATHPGLSALQQARQEANTTSAQAPAHDKDENEGERSPAEQELQPNPPGENPQQDSSSSPPSCADGACVQLGAALLAAVEGEPCRSLFVNGKCPAVCAQAIAAVTANETWPACATACGNDVVTGAAERWSEICERRQETLIDQGKEVVKGLVADGLGSEIHWRAVLQFLLAVLILVVGVSYGYRKGFAAQYAYRLQKRRLLGRKNSDNNLPI